MGYPILDFQVLTSQSPLVGEDYPREVIGEITYDLNDLQPEIRKEWEHFKKYDTIFLIYLNKDINRILIRGAEIDSPYFKYLILWNNLLFLYTQIQTRIPNKIFTSAVGTILPI